MRLLIILVNQVQLEVTLVKNLDYGVKVIEDNKKVFYPYHSIYKIILLDE